MNLALVAEMMDNFIREENAALHQNVRRANRRLHQQQMAYNVLHSAHGTLGVDYMLLYRILREIYGDYPEIRSAYRHIMDFEEMQTDDEEDAVQPLPVRRRLDLDEVEMIDLTNE